MPKKSFTLEVKFVKKTNLSAFNFMWNLAGNLLTELSVYWNLFCHWKALLEWEVP